MAVELERLHQLNQRNSLVTMMGSSSNTPRRVSSSSVTTVTSPRKLSSLPTNASSKSTPFFNTRVPLGAIPRTQQKHPSSKTNVDKSKSINSSPRYPSKDGKRAIPASRVLLDKAINSPRHTGSRPHAVHDKKDSSSADSTPNSKTPDSLDKKTDTRSISPSNSSTSNDKKHHPPALQLDFIKAALSNTKQVYSNQEIRQKAAAWTGDRQQQGQQRKTKPKSQQTNTNKQQTASQLSNEDKTQSKLYQNLQNESFVPKAKSNELNFQLKQLKKRLATETLVEEEVSEQPLTGATGASSSSLFSY